MGVATKHDLVQAEKEAVTNEAGILPGFVQPTLHMRPAVMPQASMPVVMSMQEVGNPGKYPAELRNDWKGLNLSTNVRMSAGDDEAAAAVAESIKPLRAEVKFLKGLDEVGKSTLANYEKALKDTEAKLEAA